MCLPEHVRGSPHNERAGFSRLVIHPENRGKKLFDVFIAICVMYITICVPIQVTWDVTFGEGWEIVIDIAFIMDVFVQMIHGYVDRGFPVLNIRYVAWKYLTSWFAVDVLAAIPYERIAWAAPAPVPAPASVLRGFGIGQQFGFLRGEEPKRKGSDDSLDA